MVTYKKKRVGKIIKNIRTIKIQGATNIARAGIKAYLLSPTKQTAKKVINARSTEPLLQNAIRVLIRSSDEKRAARLFLKEIKNSHNLTSKYGSRLVKSNMNVFSHCHSSTVMSILKQAKKRTKKFTVYTVEVEPRLQGRMTARELSKKNIKVIIGPDLSMEQLIKNCDLILVGADAFTKRNFYNKIGTKTICRLARVYDKPVYVCGISMKLTKKVFIEKRGGKEVWDEREKNIEVVYPAFDKVGYKLITGIVSEFGILKPKEFIKKAKRKLKEIKNLQT